MATGNDGLDHIVDSDTGEDYAWIADNALRLVNGEVGTTGIVPVYELEKIDEIALSPKCCHVVITTTDGKKHTHMRRLGLDPTEMEVVESDLKNKYDFKEDRDNPNVIEEIIKVMFPAWKESIWYDTVRLRPILNEVIIGGQYKWTVPTGKDDRIVREMRKRVFTLEQERVIQSKNAQRITTVQFKPNKDEFFDAILSIAQNNPHDPFMEEIRRTEWDGVPRLNTFLTNLGGTAHMSNPDWEREYMARVSKGIFLSIIQRHVCMNVPQSIPFVPIFIGEQNVGKSYLVRAIGLNTYFRTTKKSFDDDEKFMEAVIGGSVVELREATQFETTMSTLKSQADAENIQARFKYERFVTENIPITYTMIATTNNYAILRDDSGNRRFFSVYFEPNTDPAAGPVHMNVSELFNDIRDMSKGVAPIMYQLWAEALAYYYDTEKPMRWNTGLYDKGGVGFKRMFTVAQSSAASSLDWEYMLMQWIDKKYPKKGDKIDSIKIREFLTSDVPVDGVPGPALRGKELTDAVKRIGRSATKYDLRKIRDVNSREVGHYRLYERMADAEFSDATDLNYVPDITSYVDEDPNEKHYGRNW